MTRHRPRARPAPVGYGGERLALDDEHRAAAKNRALDGGRQAALSVRGTLHGVPDQQRKQQLAAVNHPARQFRLLNHRPGERREPLLNFAPQSGASLAIHGGVLVTRHFDRVRNVFGPHPQDLLTDRAGDIAELQHERRAHLLHHPLTESWLVGHEDSPVKNRVKLSNVRVCP